MAREEYILDAQGKDLVTILPGSWRNFRGEGTQFNAAGKRNFNVRINDISLVEMLKSRGFNVREMKKMNDDDETSYFMQVKVQFNQYGPRIIQYVQGNPNGVELDEETVGMLDNVDILDCVIKIRPYDWEMATGNKGTTAYLTELAIQIPDNRFGERFQNPGAGNLPF